MHIDLSHLLGVKVDAYFDLHRRVLSLRSLQGPCRGRVVAKPNAVVLRDVTFRVNVGGRRRALKEGARNVHAFARGFVAGFESIPIRHGGAGRRVRYNPFELESFVLAETGQPVFSAPLVAIDDGGAWIFDSLTAPSLASSP